MNQQTNIISTYISGTWNGNCGGGSGSVHTATFYYSYVGGITLDKNNNLYFADTHCGLVWMIHYSTGIASVVAGTMGSDSSIYGLVDGAVNVGKMNSGVWDVTYNALQDVVYIVDGYPNNAIRQYNPKTVCYYVITLQSPSLSYLYLHLPHFHFHTFPLPTTLAALPLLPFSPLLPRTYDD